MSECMTFPDTVEEFMDSCKIVDTEQVYSNGTEMVPIYRMRQWFEHEPEIVRCKDCKYVGTDATCCLVCNREGMGLKPYHVRKDDYCSYAERRTDGTD